MVSGTVGVVKSATNNEEPLKEYKEGDIIVLEKEARHRLVGLDNWGIVAEIWQHMDADHPSDESDIIRLQDDFNR